MKALEKEKKLAEFKQEKYRQMTMFEFLEPEDSKYSNTIELYDAIPKYFWGRQKKTKESVPIIREFSHRNTKYKVIITPATVIKMTKDNNGVKDSFVRFPSRREELIEDALRKIACNGQGVYLDNEAGVVFTLYQLKKELENMGHGYNINQIKEALFVGKGTEMKLISADGKTVIVANIFQTLGLKTQEDWKEHGANAKAFVRFNPLVTKSINEMTFRQLDYQKCMEYRYDLSRYLHKRLSHNFIHAGHFDLEKKGNITKFEIYLTTILRDSGFKAYKKLSLNIPQITKCLEELISSNVLSKYETANTYDHSKKNKISDVKFTLYPHNEFIKETKKINALKREALVKMEIEDSLNNSKLSKEDK